MAVPNVLLSSGYKMPALGLGMFLTTNTSEVDETLSAAIDADYRHIDTALSYRNESFIGEALQRLFREGKVKREEIFITTKLPPNGLRPEAVPEFFRKSLTDLQLSYVDLYLMHYPAAVKRTDDMYAVFPTKDGVLQLDTDVDIVNTWRALEKLVDEGLAKSIGLSNCNSKQIQRIYDAARIKPSVLQVECHAYLPQYELQEFCKNLGIAMTAYSPIGAPGQQAFSSGSPEVRLLDDERLKPICQKHGKSPAQVLLRYLVQRGIIVIPKSSNSKRLAENIQIFDFELTEEDMQTLKSMAKNQRYFSFTSYKGMTEHPEYPFKIPF